LGRILKFRRHSLPGSQKKRAKRCGKSIENLLWGVIVISIAAVGITYLYKGDLRSVTAGAAFARVIDGDTIHVGPDKYRLAGIDAPEFRQECTDMDGKKYACGRKAKRELEWLIGFSSVRCSSSGTDRYGRILGTCYAGDTNLNAEMVRSGWAVAYRNFSVRYVPEEREAKNRKAGVWQGEFDYPWDWRWRKR
jgi:endonuclease YncB( thermonuclease family)